MEDTKEHTTGSHPNPKTGKKKSWFLISFLLLIITLTMGSFWLTTSSAGLQFLLSTASRLSGESVQFEQIDGTLSSLSIQKMRYTSDDLRLTIETLELHWQPRLLFSGQLVINALAIGTIELHSAPSTEPAVLPDNMRLPLSISLQELTIGALHTYTLGQESSDLTITHLAARLESDDHQHHLKEIALELAFGKLTGSARLGPDHPFDLNMQATLDNRQQVANTDTPEVAVSINLTGNLEEITGKITGMSAGAQGKGTFVMRPFAAMPLEALHLSITELNPHAFLADMPKANLSIHADLNEDPAGKLQGIFVIKNGLPQSLDQNGLPFIEIRAQSLISPDEIQFDDMLVKLADQASIAGHFAWQITHATGYADLKVNQLNPAALDTRLQAAKIDGYLKLTGDTETQQGTISLRDKALSLEANVTRTETAINLEKLTLRHQASTLTGQGQFELKETQSFYFEGMLSQFDVASFVQAPRSNLNATLKLSGKLDPQISGFLNFNIAKSHFAQQSVIGKGQLTFDDLPRIKSDIDLQIGNNRLSTKGAFGAKGDRLALNITAPALGQLALGLEGDLNAQVTLADTFESPRLLIESNTQHLTVGGSHQLSDLTIAGDLHPTAVTLAIKVANYRSDADDYLKNLAITLAGNQTRHTLSIETGLPQDSHFIFQTMGKLALSMENPQKFQWRGNIETLSATGFLPLRLLNQPTLTISQNSIALEPAKIAIAEGEINLFDTAWTPQQWSSRGTLAGITLPSENIPSQNIEPLQMGGEWQITAGRQLNGHLRIARERGDWAFLLDDSPLKLGLQQLQFDARAQNNSLTADLVIRGERIGETIASGALPLIAKDGNWQIAQDRPLNGTMNVKITDLAWVGPVVDSNLKSNGQLFLQARAHGTLNQPKLEGTIEGKELGIALLDEGIHLQNGLFSAHFNQTSLQINAFTFDAPHESPPRDRLLTKIKLAKDSGKLNVTGAIDYQDRRSHLNIEIDHLPLSQQSNRWIIASGDGQISLNDRQLTINGNVVADAGFILQPEAGRPQLADDVVIIDQAPPPEDSQKLLVSVDAALDLGNHFYLRVSGLEGRLAGQLRLSSKPEQALYAIGTIATKDTRFSAYGQNLNVERGIVSFDGPLDDPGLNVLALRKNLPVEAGVEVTGSVRNPIIRLVSTPNVPDSEKLSWIVLGRAPDASGVDTSLLLTAANSILGGQSGGGIMDQIGDALGVDEFSIRQQGTGDPLTSQIGTVGKRLSSRAYLSYERGLTTAAAGITKLTYNLTRNISVVTRAGDDNAIDVFYTIQLD